MAVTLNDIYFKALALYDEISKSGTIDPSKTADYRARTPAIADVLLKELAPLSSYRKIFEYNYTPDSTKPWVKITLPADAVKIDKVILDHAGNNYDEYRDYREERNGNVISIYVKYEYPCLVRVQYKPIPTTLTSIDDVVETDDITANIMTYGLCKWFAASEQNEYVAKLCENKFKELKAENRTKQPATAEPIISKYKGW